MNVSISILHIFNYLSFKNTKPLLKLKFLIIVSVLFISQAFGQKTYILSGKIIDLESEDILIGATLTVDSLNIGTTSNINGEFKLQVPKGIHTMSVSYMGYSTQKIKVSVSKNTKLKLPIERTDINIKEVNISAEKADQNIRSTLVGAITIDAKEIKSLPSLFGEPDVIKAIKLTPGVQAGGEGDVGLYVRGGDAGQNLILLDQMPLYNPAHLLGLFSVFNTDAINDVTVYKGAIPAFYGGKTASVIDIGMKEASTEQFSGSGSIGLLSSDLTIQSPINKGKGSIIVSGRQAYLALIKPIVSPINNSVRDFFETTQYNFSDLSTKIYYKLSDSDRIYLTAYYGKDDYAVDDNKSNLDNSIVWGNYAAAARYNKVFSSKLIADLTTGITNYQFDLGASFLDYKLDLDSKILDIYAKADFKYLYENKSNLHIGIHYTRHLLLPNQVNVDLENIKYQNNNEFHSNEYAAYIDAHLKYSKKLSFNTGIRYTSFQHVGPYVKYNNTSSLIDTDSTVFNNGENVKLYHTLNPNLSAVYLLNKNSSIKGSFSITHQFIHLASVGTVSLPTDLWVPSTDYIKPQQIGIASLGYFRNFLENTIEASIEVYYKKMNNQLEFLNGLIDNFDNSKIESNLLFGQGKAYGIEFLAKKQEGKITGWLSYTLSKTLRQFDDINDGKYFPAKYDRVHDLSATMNYKLSEKWNVAATFIYATGNAMTLPTGRYVVQGEIVNEYTTVNAFRMPVYHRLDLSANYKLKKTKRIESSLNFSIYNVYSRSNPYFVYFEVKGSIKENYLNVKPKEISLFPILPSVTWNFKF